MADDPPGSATVASPASTEARVSQVSRVPTNAITEPVTPEPKIGSTAETEAAPAATTAAAPPSEPASRASTASLAAGTRPPPGLDRAWLADALAGLHFAPMIPASEIFGGGRTGWAVELAYAVDGGPDAVAARLSRLYDLGYRPILRLDYDRRQNLPPAGDAVALSRYLDFAARVVERAGGRLRFVVIGNEPNIDEAGSDPARNTECRSGRESCQPAAYAAVYRTLRTALRPLGGSLLVAGVSPGTADHPARWMGGPEYLSAILAELGPGEVDGIALHAYGLEAEPVPGLPPEPLAYFQALVMRQLAAVDAAGHGATPLFMTELNEYTAPEPAFVHAAYGWLDELNGRRKGDILAAVWFVYEGGGVWDAVALPRSPDVLAAFREVGSRYPAGR